MIRASRTALVCRKHRRGPIVGWILTLACALPACAESPPSRIYKLHYARLSEVQPVLVSALSRLQPHPTLKVDRANERIMVIGSEQAQQVTEQLLMRLDRRDPLPPNRIQPGNAAGARRTESEGTPPPADAQSGAGSANRRPELRFRGAVKTEAKVGARRKSKPADQSNNRHGSRSLNFPFRVQASPDGPGGTPEPSVESELIERKPAPAAVLASEAKSQREGAQENSPIVQRTVRLANLDAKSLHRGLELALNRAIPLAEGQVPESDAEAVRFSIESRGGQSIELHAKADQVRASGPQPLVAAALGLVEAVDRRAAENEAAEQSTGFAAYRASKPSKIRKAIAGLSMDVDRSAKQVKPRKNHLVAMLLGAQPETEEAEAADAGAQQPAGEKAADEKPGAEGPQKPKPDEKAAPDGPEAKPELGAEEGGLIGQVQIEFLEGLDVIVLRGNRRDVQRVIRIINEIEQLSAVTEPQIEVLHLEHVGSQALSDLLNQLYEEVLSARYGSVSITPLIKPNALLLVGRAESVSAVVDLTKRLDQPVDPNTLSEVFQLKHASALEAKAEIDEFFAERTGLGTKVTVTADFRTNALIVNGSPRDIAEVGALLEEIDVPFAEAVNELRVFRLENSLADELAPVLQQAVRGDTTGRGQQPGRQIGPGAGAQPGTAGSVQQARSAMLRFLTIDREGQRSYESGILSDVQITADPRANALIVSAPAESMELLGALIRYLDELPAAEVQLKVFTLSNGDAAAMVEMLESLFADRTAGGGQRRGGGGFPAVGGPGGQDEIIGLRFSVDLRTNSIIAAGTAADLAVVEAILLRLDASDIRDRETTVYRLKNSPAIDVANAINQLLQSERQVQQVAPGLVSPFEQIQREVVVVPEPVSNSLIVSSTPRFFEEIREVVEELDERPPMVMIQVLIGEVALNDTDEFGVELGFQDSLLFDRSLLGDLLTTQTTTTTTTPGGAVTTVQQDTIQAATITPGFNFNNVPLGNSGSDMSLATAANVATQGLSQFALGRVNSELGFGGFVFSASSENVSILLRALQESRRLEVLSRPQIMTLDNQPAFIQVGQRVPRITGTQINETGQVNTVQLENVGLILGVTPRISPDGLVVMEIDAEKSELGPEEEGIPISISATGDVIRSPRINTTTAQTTVSALSGQTVVLGGLITKSTSTVSRRVPLLADIPVLGNLFRFDGTASRRTELLIIMTPRIVRNEADADEIKVVESSRMSWVLSDVVELHGEVGLVSNLHALEGAETEVVYPDPKTGEPRVDVGFPKPWLEYNPKGPVDPRGLNPREPFLGGPLKRKPHPNGPPVFYTPDDYMSTRRMYPIDPYAPPVELVPPAEDFPAPEAAPGEAKPAPRVPPERREIPKAGDSHSQNGRSRRRLPPAAHKIEAASYDAPYGSDTTTAPRLLPPVAEQSPRTASNPLGTEGGMP